MTQINRSLMTLEQVRARLGGISVTTLYRQMKSGALPKPIKIGSRSMWDAAEINAAIERAAKAREAP